MSAKTVQSPYKFTAILTEEGSDSDVQGIAIPPRQPAVETAVQAIAIEPGMKCALGNHQVRVEAINVKRGMASVYSIVKPSLKGPARLADLAPIPCEVAKGDPVQVYTTQSIPLIAVVMDTDGDYAYLYSSFYGEKVWMHTSHIVSVRTAFRPRANR